MESITQQLSTLNSTGHGDAWPEGVLTVLAKTGCFKHVVPVQYGGIGAKPREKVELYQAIAAGSLTAALIFTQHAAACELIASGENEKLAQRLLPECAAGQKLLTVGISQLTTSRRGTKPAMQAEPNGDGYLLNGLMPWVTSGPKADFVVTGAVLPDEKQLLACLPMDIAGLSVKEPMKFLALSESLTCEVCCDGVKIGPEHLVRWPCAMALARRAPVKPLTVSSVGLGAIGHLMDLINQSADRLEGMRAVLEETIRPAYETLRRDLIEAANELKNPDAEIPAARLRARVNDLLVRTSATLMTLSKGTGYLQSHPAQKLLREAAFFLIWSAPPAVQLDTIKNLWNTK